MDPKSGIMVSGVMVLSTRSENHDNEDFSDFWATLLIKFTVTMAPQTPPDHKSKFSYRKYGIFSSVHILA